MLTIVSSHAPGALHNAPCQIQQAPHSFLSQSGAAVARQVHTLEAMGSIPISATRGYLPKVDTHVYRSPGFLSKTGTSCILGEASTVRSDAGLMAKACEWCRTFSCNSGGAHPLTHLVVDERQLCVDVEIAWALKLAWENKIPTSNSCQAWREWAPEEVPPPWKRRIDVDNDKDAHRLAQLLQLRRYDLDPNNWGGISLTWFNDDERC